MEGEGLCDDKGSLLGTIELMDRDMSGDFEDELGKLTQPC